jgi:hypothetical protein
MTARLRFRVDLHGALAPSNLRPAKTAFASRISRVNESVHLRRCAVYDFIPAAFTPDLWIHRRVSSQLSRRVGSFAGIGKPTGSPRPLAVVFTARIPSAPRNANAQRGAQSIQDGTSAV